MHIFLLFKSIIPVSIYVSTFLFYSVLLCCYIVSSAIISNVSIGNNDKTLHGYAINL